jgi:hypothetical protein
MKGEFGFGFNDVNCEGKVMKILFFIESCAKDMMNELNIQILF